MEIVPYIAGQLSTAQKARIGYELGKRVWENRADIYDKMGQIKNYFGKKRRTYYGHKKFKSTSSSAKGAVTRYKSMANMKGRSRVSKRKWKSSRRFRKRVIAAIQNEQNSQFFRFSNVGIGSTTVDTQGIVVLGHIGTYDGVNGEDDMFQIKNTMDPIVYQKNSAGSPVAWQNKNDSYFTIRSGRAQCDFKNGGSSDLTLDVYALDCRRSSTGFTSVFPMCTTGSGYWQNLASSTAASQVTIGLTPYQYPDLVQHFRISGVTRYQVQSGTGISINLACRKYMRIDGGDLDHSTDKSPCRPGLTRILVGIVRGSPSADGRASPTAYSYNFTRVYNVGLPINMNPESTTVLATNV